MNSLYGKTIQKDITTTSHLWCGKSLSENYDETIKSFEPFHSNLFYVEKKKDEKEYYEDEQGKQCTTLSPSQLGVFILSHSKRIMNNFIVCVDGVKKPNIYYGDTDSIHLHSKHYDKLQEHEYVGLKLSQGKNDYEDGGIIYGLYLAPKIKFNIIINKDKILEYKQTFKGCPKDEITFEAYLRLKEGEDFDTKQRKSWSRNFQDGITIYDDDDLTEKTYTSNINVMKRQTPNTEGIMYPYTEGEKNEESCEKEEYYNKVIFDVDYNCFEDNDYS